MNDTQGAMLQDDTCMYCGKKENEIPGGLLAHLEACRKAHEPQQ